MRPNSLCSTALIISKINWQAPKIIIKVKGMTLKKLLLLSLLSYSLFAQGLQSIYQEFENANYEDVIEKLNEEQYKKRKDQKYLGVRSYLLGVSHARLQDFELAIKYFKDALKNKNDAKEIYYELGQAQYAINQLDDSINNFKNSIKIKYKVEQSTYYIAYINQLKEDLPQAKKYYKLLLKNKDTSIEMKQIAYYQVALINLDIARGTNRASEIVEKYILPDLYRAINILPNSSTADDIDKRILDIRKEFYLEEDKLVNGAPLPSQRLNLGVSEKIAYDNNVTRSDDLPSSTGTNKDSFYSQTRFNISKAYNFKRRYTLTPRFELTSTTYSDRNDTAIFSNDSYNITPEVDFSFAYKYKKKPARFFLNYTYDYQARDINSEKERQYTYRSNQFSLGTELPHFEIGNTSISIKSQSFTYYNDSLNRASTIFSIDQIIKKNYGIFILLYQYDMSDYENNETLSTNSHLFRLDYLYPGIFPNTTLNIGLADMLISYDDVSQDAARGLESNISFNTKFIRVINRNLSFNVEYLYTNNISDEDASNYTAHQTSFELNYDY